MNASGPDSDANSLVQLWPDQKAHGPFGDPSAHCAQDLTKAWSAACFQTIRRRKLGGEAALPLKKRYLFPVTWRKGEFTLHRSTEQARARVELATRRGAENLVLSLSHDHPYDPGLVRSVRLVAEAGELFLDFTAWVAVVPAEATSGLLAGVDPGIIHPLAVACGSRALLVSGRASRAEEFLHLEDSRARGAKMSAKRAPLRARPGSARRAGSRAWRKLHSRQRWPSPGPGGSSSWPPTGRRALLLASWNRPRPRAWSSASRAGCETEMPARCRTAGRTAGLWCTPQEPCATGWRRSGPPPSSPRRAAPPRTAPIAGR